MRLRLWIALLALAAPALLRADDVFGSKDSQVGLIGILYDFKQTQKREPTHVQAGDYERIVNEFLDKDWSESVLNRYFRATRPLFTTQIYIPLMSAGEAPKAFEMEKVIKPSQWVIFYKGQVSPPEDGTYRFIGYADDLLAVAVNGKTACIGARMKLNAWKPTKTENSPNVPAANGNLTYGDWIPMKKDEPLDLDVLIGERPGGQFGAFLLYQKQGASYPNDAAGLPMYPIFQLAPHDTAAVPIKRGPPFSLANEVWKYYQ